MWLFENISYCFTKNFIQYRWFISPEFTLIGNYSPDYLIGKIIGNPALNYGTWYHHLVVKVKYPHRVSWQKLLSEQAWD